LRYVGVDVHKDSFQVAALNDKGALVREARIPSVREDVRAFFRILGRAKVAMEAMGLHERIYDPLESMDFEVVLAHPSQVQDIAEAKVKTDKVDARTLAHLLRADLLPERNVPDPEIRRLRSLVAERVYLMRAMTREKNQARFELLTRIPGVGTFLACLLIAYIADVRRLPDAEALTGYAGLAPSIRPSGDTLYHGRITKEGACLLRWGLVHAVRAPLFHGGDTSPMRFPGRIAAKRGKAKAAAATARKLLQVVHWTLREGEPYHGAGRQPMQLSCG